MQWAVFSEVLHPPLVARTSLIKIPYSYDTEALNKQQLLAEPDDLLFVNTFTDATHKKVTLGVQQLYIIGKAYLILLPHLLIILIFQEFLMLFPC